MFELKKAGGIPLSRIKERSYSTDREGGRGVSKPAHRKCGPFVLATLGGRFPCFSPPLLFLPLFPPSRRMENLVTYR